MARKGDWVLLSSTVLSPNQRAPQVPEDTRGTPLVQWVKGHLLMDAEIGEEAQALTRTGRRVSGILCEVSPAYSHSFGAFIPELQKAQDSAREALWGRGGSDGQ